MNTATKEPKMTLMARHREQLANFACEKLIDGKTKAAIVKAEAKLIDAFCVVATNVQDDMAILKKYGLAEEIDVIAIYAQTLYPNHDRPKNEWMKPYIHYNVFNNVMLPRKYLWPNMGQWTTSNTGPLAGGKNHRAIRPPEFSEITRMAKKDETGRQFHMPDKASRFYMELMGDTKFGRALYDCHLAYDDHRLASADLVNTMCQFIGSTKTFHEIHEVWPEVGEYRTLLFPEQPVSLGALVVIDPAKVNALLANLRERGVKGSTLKAARKPSGTKKEG